MPNAILNAYNKWAFLYVTGSLRGIKRTLFEAIMNTNTNLEHEVLFWQEQLISLNTESLDTPAKPETWQAINKRLGAQPQYRSQWLTPAIAGASFASFCIITLVLLLSPPSSPPPDYLAILADANGSPVITAASFEGQKRLTLQWSAKQPQHAMQLWAKSKRDGQYRSIAVLETPTQALELSIAQWRLITDAHSLLLSAEEEGGSAIDEPSDRVIASGPCIRMEDAHIDT